MAITDFALSYQKTPIVLSGGVAGAPGNLLPLIAITQAQDYTNGVLGNAQLGPNDFLFDFYPMPGATLGEFQLGQYPFANQTVAGNAIITEPLRISMMMVASVRNAGGYAQKASVFPSLRSSINQHAQLGGTYNIATPSFIYQNCILLSLRDISSGDPMRPQDRWQWDFIQPLLTLEDGQQYLNSYTQKAQAGLPQTTNASGGIPQSGPAQAVGSSIGAVAPSILPSAKSSLGASVPGAS